eukprot:1998619-Pyramimonas_sp.AAC.1
MAGGPAPRCSAVPDRPMGPHRQGVGECCGVRAGRPAQTRQHPPGGLESGWARSCLSSPSGSLAGRRLTGP